MPSPIRTASFGSAKVSWLDREAAWRLIDEAARRLRRARPDVEEVHVFGSLARGGGGAASDVDILVVVTASDLHPRDRPADLAGALGDTGLPPDITVYTRAELERLKREKHPFLAAVLAESRRLA